jgi:hypothetical protein
MKAVDVELYARNSTGGDGSETERCRAASTSYALRVGVVVVRIGGGSLSGVVGTIRYGVIIVIVVAVVSKVVAP